MVAEVLIFFYLKCGSENENGNRNAVIEAGTEANSADLFLSFSEK